MQHCPRSLNTSQFVECKINYLKVVINLGSTLHLKNQLNMWFRSTNECCCVAFKAEVESFVSLQSKALCRAVLPPSGDCCVVHAGSFPGEIQIELILILVLILPPSCGARWWRSASGTGTQRGAHSQLRTQLNGREITLNTSVEDYPPGRHGEPGHGGSDPPGEPHAGCLLRHRPERQPRPASDRRGGRAECGEELGAGELRGQVSRFQAFTPLNAPCCRPHALPPPPLSLYSI